MKKFIFTATAAIFFLGAMTSCNKERTCVCHYDFGDQEKESIEYAIKKTDKKTAKDICSAGVIAEGAFGQKVGATSCELIED
jgi:hypothetical protein